MFYLEGLHRTRYTPALLGVALLGGVLVLPQAEKLPLLAQRSLSFLPGKFNFMAQESAAGSLEWRLEMWKDVLPDVPKCLLRGKGWGIDSRELDMDLDIRRCHQSRSAGTILVGDYHNGPLSVLIPFGLYGAIALRLVPGGGPAGAASELEVRRSGAPEREHAAAGGLRCPGDFLHVLLWRVALWTWRSLRGCWA